VAAGSVLGIQLETPLSSETAHVEDSVEARVSRDVRVDGRVAIPYGTRVLGSVVLVERGGKLKDRARIGVRFTTLVLTDSTRVPINTEMITREGEPPSAESSRKIGGGAIGGAIIGAILGGGKGAAIGGGIGAAGGTAAVMAGGRHPAILQTGATLAARIVSPVTITVEK
jgi:type IV secretory pathway VirB10-like protein